MTESELEKVRTAIVIKTYTAIIRCVCAVAGLYAKNACLFTLGTRPCSFDSSSTPFGNVPPSHPPFNTIVWAVPFYRNYSSMSNEEQDAELARVRAFSRALFYNVRGDEDRWVVVVFVLML